MYRISKSSKTGQTREVVTIGFEPGPKTHAAALLLKHELKMQDADYLQSYGFRMERVQFSRDTLTRWKAQLGDLFCVYCQKPGLIIEYDKMLVDPPVMATLEHLDPTSKGGDFFDLSRIVCACGTCNKNRSNKELEPYLDGRKIRRPDFDARCSTYFNLNK